MLIVLCFCIPVHAEQQGFWKKMFNLPAIGVPIITHSPETKWGFGLGVQGYFKLPFSDRTSIIYGNGCYTLNKQFYFNLGGTLYFGGKNPWFMQIRGGYRNYPDVYYPIGNTIDETHQNGTKYMSRRASTAIQAQIYLPAHWSFGPAFDFVWERIDKSIDNTTIMWALGAVAQYDTRDTLYYPRKGLFFKASVMHYEPKLGSSFRMTYMKVDLRHFISLPKDIIFAWQFDTEWALSDNVASIPFMYLPTIGGQDLVRGVRRNMFRDNASIALQAEFRFPIWKFIRFHAFAGIGDVYNTDHWNWATPKIGYGLGLRIGINDAHINIRLDVARSNIYKNWNTWESYAFYLTATEAF